MQRPGIICYFIVHSVEIDGKQAIHGFAVVNWLMLSEQDFGFGIRCLFGMQETLRIVDQQFFACSKNSFKIFICL